MSGEYPIKALCATLAVSRSGYYAWARGSDSTHARRDRELRAKIAPWCTSNPGKLMAARGSRWNCGRKVKRSVGIASLG